MALDPSLAASKSESAIPRSDHPFQTPYPSFQSPPIHPTTTSNIATSLSAASLIEATMQDSNSVPQLAESPTPDTNGTSLSDGDSQTTGALNLDVDPQILEALKSKDRIYVLKLGETFEALIMERRQRVELTPSTSYQRLLVHRCSAYYKLMPETDPVTKGISVLTTSDSRIPDRRISELVPAEPTAQPAFKIMRRSVLERRSKPQSHAGSVAGEDELSDPEQSETGSLGGHSNATNSSNKKRMTIEEREAAYQEARTRIFMDFEEKEKGKDKDMSASSSTLSLNGSTSTSAGGRSSLGGDTDDAASSPATESEWSAPSGSNARDKKDGRRGGPPNASASSSRSLRNGGSFHANSSGGSSRNSRAPSPSFSYASLHDSPMGQIYDPSQHHPSPGYFPNQYAYPYPPPGQGPAPPFLAPYPYYPQQHYNPYQSPPPVPQHNSADPTTPSSAEPYSPPHQVNYVPHYGWPPHPQQPPLQSPPHTMHMPIPPQQPQQNSHPMGPAPSLPPHSPQYQPFAHPVHAYSYPMNGYYPPAPNGQQMPPPPPPHNMSMQPAQQPPPQHQQQPQSQHQQQQQPQHHQPQHQQHANEFVPRGGPNGSQTGHMSNGHFNNNHNGLRNGLGNGIIPPNNNSRSASSSRNGTPGMSNNGSGPNGYKRGTQPSRSAWSYGPGFDVGPYSTPMAPSAGDAVGPRLSNMNRRTSGNSSSGGNSRASSNCDEVSSTSSSTTSSSSRRTYTSTTSSQHPLPPRPDWAVGIKAQPTLAGGRHHDMSLANSRTMSPISPPRSSNGHNSPMGTDSNNSPRHPSVSLQAQDFPPLTSVAPEKRTPVVTGAWGSSRPILSPTNGNINMPGNAGSVHHSPSPISRQEENDRGVIERPSPKAGETFNPKLVRRPPPVGAAVNGNGNGHGHQRPPSDRSKEAVKEAVKGDATATPAGLAAQISALSLEGENEHGVVETSSISNEANPAAVASPST